MNNPMFVGFEISPVAEDSKGTVEAFETIAAATGAARANGAEMFWSLYGRLPSGGVECIADRKAFSDAASLYALLTGLAGPGAPGRYIDLAAPNADPIASQKERVLKVLRTSESLLEEAMHVHVYGEPDLKDIPDDSPYLLAIEEIREVLRLV